MDDPTDRYAVKKLLDKELLDVEMFDSYKSDLLVMLNKEDIDKLKIKPP